MKILFAMFFVTGVSLNTFAATDCKTAALDKAYAQFKVDSQWSDQEIAELTYVDDKGVYAEVGDEKNVLTVDINSSEIHEWDGYATYKVTVEPTAAGCTAVKAVLFGSEGI